MHWILWFGNLVAFAIGVIASVSVIGGVILLVVKVLTLEEYRNRRRSAGFSRECDKFIYRSSTADAPLE